MVLFIIFKMCIYNGRVSCWKWKLEGRVCGVRVYNESKALCRVLVASRLCVFILGLVLSILKGVVW